MLTVHHLGKSQSERIVWLCEELGIPYELKLYDRDPVTRLAPPEYKALHPLGAAPVITDGDLVLAELGAIIEYIIGQVRQWPAGADARPSELRGLRLLVPLRQRHAAAGDRRNMILSRLDLAARQSDAARHEGAARPGARPGAARLAKADYFAGSEFTTADIMIVFTLTTMRLFLPLASRLIRRSWPICSGSAGATAYQRAMHKGDPDLKPLLV